MYTSVYIDRYGEGGRSMLNLDPPNFLHGLVFDVAALVGIHFLAYIIIWRPASALTLV